MNKYYKVIHGLSAAMLASAIMAGHASALPANDLIVTEDSWHVAPDNNVYDNVILQDGAIIYGSPLVVSGEYQLGRGWVSSNLTGDADLIKTAHWGTVYLTGSNSYTGSTTINEGILSIGDRDSDVTGSISGASLITIANNTSGLELYLADGSIFSNNIANTGTVTVLTVGGTNTLSGVISGTGNFVQDGTGVTILTGTNLSTGQTIVSNGTLRMGTSYALSGTSGLVVSGPGIFDVGLSYQNVGSLSGDGTVLFNAETNFETSVLTVGYDHSDSIFSGRLTGHGGFAKGGNGTLTLTGTSDMTGAIGVFGGVLQAGAQNIFSKKVDLYIQDGSFDLNNFDQEVGGLVGSGSASGLINLGSAYLTVNSNNESWFAGDITGTGGLHKMGTGELYLIGNTSYTGQTYLHEGTLNVGGSIESVLVQGGQLRGNGEIRSSLVNTGGVVDPGGFNGWGYSPIGTLYVGGDFVQTSGGTTLIQIAGRSEVGPTLMAPPPSLHDRIVVTGTAFLGGRLADEYLNGYKVKKGDKFIFLTADGGIVGKYAKGPEKRALLHLAVGYGSNSVWLKAKQDDFTSLSGLSVNQKSVARALDKAVSKGQLRKLTDRLVEAPLSSLPDTLQLLSPEQVAAVFNIGFASAQIQSTNIEHRLSDARRGSSGFSTNGLALSNSRGSVTLDGAPVAQGGEQGLTLAGFDGKSLVGKQTVLPVETGSRWSFFATGSGQWADIETTAQGRGSEFTTGGVTIGGDYRVNPNLVVGIAGSYANTDSDLANGGKVSVNSGKGSVYGTLFNDNAYLNALVGGGYNDYDIKRGSLGGVAKGSTNGGEFNALLGGGYDLHFGGLSIGPVGSLQYTYLELGDFQETASNAVRLRFSKQHQESLKSALGVKASYGFNVRGVAITPEVRAQWQHEYLDSTAAITAGFVGTGSLFTVSGPRLGRDSLLIDAGATVQFSPSVAAFAYYTGEIGRSNYSSNGVNGGFRISF